MRYFVYRTDITFESATPVRAAVIRIDPEGPKLMTKHARLTGAMRRLRVLCPQNWHLFPDYYGINQEGTRYEVQSVFPIAVKHLQ